MKTNTYADQFFVMDPAAPPTAGKALTFNRLHLTDAGNDGLFKGQAGDLVDGSAIVKSWPGDVVTIRLANGSNVTYPGATFYLADGRQVFTPTDGQVLKNGAFVSSTYVTQAGTVQLTQLGPACFTLGTRIAVPGGQRPIEALAVGDLVLTLDHGAQPVRWIGRREVEAKGDDAPVRFAAGTIGNQRALCVSPQHRMLVRSAMADLLFAAPEVLVPARHLVGQAGITCAPRPSVTYMHLLFDRHEILWAEGSLSESFHPGGRQIAADRALRSEIARIFPDCPGLRPGPRPRAARPILTGRETRLLTAGWRWGSALTSAGARGRARCASAA